MVNKNTLFELSFGVKCFHEFARFNFLTNDSISSLKSCILCRRFRNKFYAPQIGCNMGGVIPEVSSDTLLFLYLLGLQLLEVVTGKNRHWLIRSKRLLPSSELVHQTSKSNCCSVNEDNHRLFALSSATCFRSVSTFATPTLYIFIIIS